MTKQAAFDLHSCAHILERTPRVLRALLDGIGPEWQTATEGEGTWSPVDVLGHLIHGERTDWIPRARIILAQGGDRRFAPFDRSAQFHESAGKSVAGLLEEFDVLRRESLATLRGWQLTETHFELRGVHPEFGEVTLRQLLATWVAHDLGHLVQVARTMAKRYRDAVGPWRKYLSVMDR